MVAIHIPRFVVPEFLMTLSRGMSGAKKNVLDKRKGRGRYTRNVLVFFHAIFMTICRLFFKITLFIESQSMSAVSV